MVPVPWPSVKVSALATDLASSARKTFGFGVLVAGLEEVAAELGLFGVLLLRIRFSGAGGLGTAFAVATTLANDILLRASSRAFVAT